MHILFVLQAEDLKFRLDQLAGACNILSRFKFVTSEHPDLYVCRLQVVDHLRHLVLKLVFDRCGAEKCQVAFKFTVMILFCLLVADLALVDCSQFFLECLHFVLIKNLHAASMLTN